MNELLAGSALARMWEAEAVESWHSWLRPVHVQGSFRGGNPWEGYEPAEAPGGPLAVLTRGSFSPVKAPAFWFSALPRPLSDLPNLDGFLAGVGMTRRPYADVASFTVWRSTRDALEFAYTRAPHRETIERNRRAKIFSSFLSARFQPYKWSGTWNGRDPPS